MTKNGEVSKSLKGMVFIIYYEKETKQLCDLLEKTRMIIIYLIILLK